MDSASAGIARMFSLLTDATSVADTLIAFVKQTEMEYSEGEQIALFVYALRCFFCWPRASELCGNKEALDKIRSIWMQQNQLAYEDWLTSSMDESHSLRWEKWTFQAKNSLLDEFLASNVCGAVSRPPAL